MRGDGDPLRTVRRELDREPPELRGERDERPEHLEVGLIDDGDVDGLGDDAALERRHDLLGDDDARAILRLVGRRRQMRRDDDSSSSSSGPSYGSRREDVQRGSGELAGSNRLGEGVLVDERAAGRVDEPGAVAHLRDRLAVDQPARLVRERRMKRHDVRSGEHLFERRRPLHPEVAEPVLARRTGRTRRPSSPGRPPAARPVGRSGRTR